MPDFSVAFERPEKTIIHTLGPDTLLGQWALITTNTGGASLAWTVANKAFFVAFTIQMPFLAQKMGVQVATQSGNVDVGIYGSTGKLIVSSGTTAVAAAGLQVFDIADTWLNPGTYFMAQAVDNTTAAFRYMGGITGQMLRTRGVQEMATAFVLPATATFANPTAVFTPVIMIQGVATL